MTLLLGPPGSGKTTLLLALAGRLDKDLKVSGDVTYNGHGMEEFVPERTAAYISQHDLHIGEMTVRETLAFSARCQGVGTRFGTILCNKSRALARKISSAARGFCGICFGLLEICLPSSIFCIVGRYAD